MPDHPYRNKQPAMGASIPKVTVVIPNYNHARFLTRRIETVLQQTSQDFEVILLDDCSTDDSRSIISSYANHPKVRIELNCVNSGSPFKQWNKGVRLARGEYIWIAESDDYSDLGFLQHSIGVLDSEAKAAFVYCRSRCISADDELQQYADHYLSYFQTTRWAADYLADGREECQNYFLFTNIVPNASAVVFRKAVYEQVGGADESYRLCGDWKLWASLALTGEVAHIGDALNYFRFHDDSVRGRDKRLDVLAVETPRVVDWLLKMACPPHSEITKIRKFHRWLWTTAITQKGLTNKRRREILRNATLIDPFACLRLIPLIYHKAVRYMRDNARVFLWHPTLNVTRPMRQALGLRRKQKSI